MRSAESAPAVGVTEISSDDWRLWRPLRLAALTDSPAAFRSTLAEWSGPGDTEQRWRDRLSSVALNLVLDWGDEPAGIVSATAPDADGTALLMSMWVASCARGHGVGDAAIERVRSWAWKQPGFTQLMLTVEVNNLAAMRLYRRHGFLDAGPVAQHSDERWMRQNA
jgi:RimJ/RimL family protein N-acetyltransferase